MEQETAPERGLVDRQHFGWWTIEGVETSSLDSKGVRHPPPRHRFPVGHIDPRLVTRSLSQLVDEPAADPFLAGQGRMPFPRSPATIPTPEPALTPQENRRIATTPIPDPAEVAAMTDNVDRPAMETCRREGRIDLHL